MNGGRQVRLAEWRYDTERFCDGRGIERCWSGALSERWREEENRGDRELVGGDVYYIALDAWFIVSPRKPCLDVLSPLSLSLTLSVSHSPSLWGLQIIKHHVVNMLRSHHVSRYLTIYINTPSHPQTIIRLLQ